MTDDKIKKIGDKGSIKLWHTWKDVFFTVAENME